MSESEAGGRTREPVVVHHLPGGLRSTLEAVLMVVDEPVSVADLAAAFDVGHWEIRANLEGLEVEYRAQQRGFTLHKIDGTWRMYSRPAYAEAVSQFLLDGQQAKLTQAALETLAVIAYRQPISRSRVGAIRGANVDGVTRTLVTRGLITEAGEGRRPRRHAVCHHSLLSATPGAVFPREAARAGAVPAESRHYRRTSGTRTRMNTKKPRAGQRDNRTNRGSGGKVSRYEADQLGIGTTKNGQPVAPPRERTPRPASKDVHVEEGTRLQKVLAQAGVGSRRHCEDLIAEGRVEVDGQVVTELGTRVDPEGSVIHVDGDRIQLDDTLVYIAFNKPPGVVSTMEDDMGRPSVGEYLEGRTERLFHVGRLDQDTEGLLLLTNDGDLANRLQHPRYGVEKVYLATIHGSVPRDLGKRLREGIELEDGPAKVDSFRVVDSQPGMAMVEVVIHEGRNHIVRRMFEEMGHPVIALARPQVGPVKVGELRPGKMRPLNKREVAALYKAAGL